MNTYKKYNNINNYYYNSKGEYASINKKIVQKEQRKHLETQNFLSYKIYLDYYYNYFYESYYIVIPKDYKKNFDYYKSNQENIFSKGRIISFYYPSKNYYKSFENFSFDAIVDFVENDLSYAYIIPIKTSLRDINKIDLTGNYLIKERNGEITFIRMLEAINEFSEGNQVCGNLITNKILGKNINENEEYKKLSKLFNYKRFFINQLQGFGYLTKSQNKTISNLFNNVMNTVELKENCDMKTVCFLIYAVYQMRKNPEDKILICSSSNASADRIALDLLKMNDLLKAPMNLLRIYANNQEIIKRNKKLNDISFHKIMKQKYIEEKEIEIEVEVENNSNYNNNKETFDEEKEEEYEDEDEIIEGRNEIIDGADVVISTCVNSYNDNLINYNFPYVIIINANNANENESLIPLTLGCKFTTFISYGDDNYNNSSRNDYKISLYERMKYDFPKCHFSL